MFPQMRTKPDAQLLEAVRPACGHSLPGGWCFGPVLIRVGDRRLQNPESTS